MSYCRWSSDNFQCDLYCYEDVAGGFTTHVARRRITGTLTPLPELTETNVEAYVKALAQRDAEMEVMEKAPIGLPHDGETFNDATLEDFLGTVSMLRKAGYNVPEYVFGAIREEIAGLPQHAPCGECWLKHNTPVCRCGESGREE